MQAFTSSKVAHKQQTLTSKLTVSETEKHAFIHMCELKTPFEWTRWTVFSRAIWHGPLLDKWQNWQIRITIPLIATSLASPIRIYQAHSTVYMLYWMNVFDLKDTRNFSRCRLLPRIRSNVSFVTKDTVTKATTVSECIHFNRTIPIWNLLEIKLNCK